MDEHASRQLATAILKHIPKKLRELAMKLSYKYDHEEGKKYPKNYRPISLLPCDYKILSRILQQSLGPHMQHILYTMANSVHPEKK